MTIQEAAERLFIEAMGGRFYTGERFVSIHDGSETTDMPLLFFIRLHAGEICARLLPSGIEAGDLAPDSRERFERIKGGRGTVEDIHHATAALAWTFLDLGGDVEPSMIRTGATPVRLLPGTETIQ